MISQKKSPGLGGRKDDERIFHPAGSTDTIFAVLTAFVFLFFQPQAESTIQQM
jgi:hypothetical protein